MDKVEARLVLADLLAPYRSLPHSDLGSLVTQQPQAEAVVGSAGGRYQAEVEAMWDDRPGGPVRIAASLFDDGWRSTFLPLTEAFIKAPDGSFVGE